MDRPVDTRGARDKWLVDELGGGKREDKEVGFKRRMLDVMNSRDLYIDGNKVDPGTVWVS